MTDHSDPTGEALARFLAELLDVVVVLAATLEHMCRWREAGRSVAGAPPPAAVLTMLLRSVLDDVAYEHGALALEGAATLLRDTASTLAEELIFVPVDDRPPCIPGRRHRR
jgi:hypothetical protein